MDEVLILKKLLEIEDKLSEIKRILPRPITCLRSIIIDGKGDLVAGTLGEENIGVNVRGVKVFYPEAPLPIGTTFKIGTCELIWDISAYQFQQTICEDRHCGGTYTDGDIPEITFPEGCNMSLDLDKIKITLITVK